jgi:hypothetical protein
LGDIQRTNEQLEQLTALVSEAKTEYSLVRVQLDKAEKEERFAKVRLLSLVA